MLIDVLTLGGLFASSKDPNIVLEGIKLWAPKRSKSYSYLIITPAIYGGHRLKQAAVLEVSYFSCSKGSNKF